MNSNDDSFLFVLVFLVCPALYVGARILPELVFYLGPLAGSAFLVGHAWRAICEAKEVNYRRVAGLMAGTILVLILTVGFPQNEVITSKGKVLLQSPWIYQVFNGFSEWVEACINGSWLRFFRPTLPYLFPPLVHQPNLYDLRHLAWCLWLGVCVGAPAIFLYYGHKRDQERIQKYADDCAPRTHERRMNM